jgi:hypothetical protein
MPAYENYTTTKACEKTGSAFGNFVHNIGGLAKLVAPPSNVSSRYAPYIQYCYAQSGGYLKNCDALFCPGDTTFAPTRATNPVDTHGWALYDYTDSPKVATNYNGSGYWYMNVQEDEREIGYETPQGFFTGMKRYKVDGEDPSQKCVVTDLGHCPQFYVGSEYLYKMSHQLSGWNTMYADGHVNFHQLNSVYASVGAYGYANGRYLFLYFDQHP